MVRSEDEIRKYDIFKGTILGLLVICTAFAYGSAKRAASLREVRMGLSVVTPGEEMILDNEVVDGKVLFSGDAPGKAVHISQERKLLGSSKVHKYAWKIWIDVADLVDKEIFIRAVDEDGKELAQKGPKWYTVSDEVRKRVEERKTDVKPLPVDITAPGDGQTIPSGAAGIFGTGVPKTKVKIYLNKEFITFADVDEDGNWQISRRFYPGQQTLSAVTPTHKSTINFQVAEDN